ncbi:MAG: radical SAM protein [Clostridiales bacterium]|nr:radical SAM protein [Clostridiales bacterium]
MNQLATARFRPETMNIELTTICPLRCPQCYCSLSGGKVINPQAAVHWIEEGGKSGVKNVMLSGGETLCYPYLLDVVSAAAKCCVTANVALSGFGFTERALDSLVGAGVGGIFISLNGSTEEINSLTRDGFSLAVSALGILKESGYPNTWINWVMHSSNACDFLNVVALAEEYSVKSLVVMAAKPDSSHQLATAPTRAQMLSISQTIKTYKGNARIYVEECFSPMLALVKDTKLFGNFNTGENKGCMAGRSSFCVNVDGMLSPCRHLDYFEKFERLDDYWNNSEILSQIREAENSKEEPCVSCRFGDYCRPCLAMNSKMKGGLFFGHDTCSLQQ